MANKPLVPEGEKGSGMNWEIRVDIYTLLHIKQITSRDQPYSPGNAPLYWPLWEKSLKEPVTYTTDAFRCVPEITTTL